MCVRFSPTGSVVVLAERQRAKSESPNRPDELRQPSSQVEKLTTHSQTNLERTDRFRNQSVR